MAIMARVVGIKSKRLRKSGFNKATGRNYKSEYANYQSKPEQRAKHAARNRARYALMKRGVVKVGDGKDVDHKNSNPLDNRDGNLRVMSKRANRSFRRDRKARELPGYR